MRLVLDEQPTDITADTIGEAIAMAGQIAEQQGRVIVEVTVDGTQWGEAELSSPDYCQRPAGEIRLVSTNLASLVSQTLRDATEALADADVLQQEAAGLIQAGQSAPAMEKLGQALGIWQTVQEAVLKSSQAISLDLDSITVGSSSLRTMIQRLNEQLIAMRDALQADDPVRLSDTLLYELPDIVAEWREAMDTMRDRATGQE